MKGWLAAIIAVLLFVQLAFSATPITTNSFVRHDIGFSATLLDFAVGAWRTNGESMVAAVTRTFNLPSTNAPETKLEIVAIGANSEPKGAALVYSAPGATGPISIGDIDGDGANDIVYGAGTNVVARLNTSSATGPAFDLSAGIAVGGASIPLGMALVDLDGDGKLDIVYGTGAIYAFRNQSTLGAISFAAPITIYTNAATFEVADLDGDGRPDLEVRPSQLMSGSYLRNTSSVGAITFAQSSAGLARGFLVDVNGDTKADHVSLLTRIFTPIRGESSVSLSISTNASAAGTIAFAKTIGVEIDVPLLTSASKIRGTLPSFRPDFTGADFNLDGRVDFVWTSYTNEIVFLENLNGAPQYLTTWGSGVEFGSPSYPYEPTVADVNDDGKLDLLVGGGSRFVSIFENRIEPTPEIVVLVGAPVVDLGGTVNLKATAYAADVTAIDFFEDAVLVANGTAANGFSAQYQPSKAGVHRITARATAGANAGLASKAVGLRVRDANLGRVVGFGSGVASETTLLIYDSGRTFGVGSNTRGQLADVFYDAPHAGFVEIPAPANAGVWKSLSAGPGFTIGLTTSNRVFSWGINDVGQLARDTITTTNPEPAEISFIGGGAIQKIGAGRDFAVALDATGELFSWGANGYGQLGKSNTSPRSRPIRIKKPDGVARWTDVSVGFTHVLALDDAGQLFGWGWNYWGQAGQPRTNDVILTPTLIELPPGEIAWTNMDAGMVVSHAQTASGRTYRWGDYITDAGLVVDHTPTLVEAPDGSGGFQTVGAGSPLSVALGKDGNAYVWGGGILSPTGLGDDMAVTNPTRLPLPAGVQRWNNIAVASRRAAALADDGRVFVWGFDFHDALGTGHEGANVPTEPCLPFENCVSNYPPAVKIVHPVYGDLFPADRVLRFEIAAEDFDGVVEFVRIIQQDAVLVPGTFGTTTKQTEVARLRFGETAAEVPAPAGSLFATTYFAIAYDNSGLISTGATLRLTFPTSNSGPLLTLTNAAPTNALTGWREIFASFRNNSSFYYGSVTAVLSNVPPGVVIRNNSFPSGTGVESITHPYGVAPGETISFRIEYKLSDDVDGAQIPARFFPGAPMSTGSSAGEVQPLTMTILTNGFRTLEFDHVVGQQYVVQFSDTLTNWIDAGGFFEDGNSKMLWIDGGPPATAKHPAQAGRRFYRVLRKP